MPDDGLSESSRQTVEAVPATVAAAAGTERTAAAAAADASLPLRVGRFVPIACIGRGGMGVVFSAYDPELDRKIALKCIAARRGGAPDTRVRDRTLREARSLARLTHPNVVAVYDVGTVADEVYIAMELVDGESLDVWIGAAPPWRTIVATYVQAGRGLAAAHAAGLVHRDFKPSNAVRARDGRVVVLDFGLAREPVAGAELPVPAPRLDPRSTEGGALLGTPAYMSPEQWRGLVVDARSDQFNFCVALWEALVGVHPFDRSSTVALANAVTAGAVIEPPPGRVPRGLLRVVRRGLSQEPERRWPSMDALLDALVAASKRRRWPLVAGAATGLLAIAWLAQPPAGPREPEDACAGADARMAAAWTDARRADIGRAFAAIGRDFADDAWQRVSPELDAYARAWSAAALDACHAHAPGETELDAHLDASLAARDACLGEALHRFDALVERLRHAPVDSVVRATDAVAALPPLARCVETDAAPGSARAVTLDPNRDELQQHLAELVTALAAGDDEAARRTATRLQPAVAGVRDPALRIAITRALAELESHTRGPLEASRTLDAAATEALTLGLDAAFLDVTADLVAQLVLIGSSLDVAQTWWTVAEATARRSDADAASEVPLLRAGTLLALTRHQLARAHALASRGRDRARAELGDANVLTLACEGDLARVAMLRRDYDEALATYASLLARARDTYGPLHPRTLELRTFELQARTEAGRSEEALALALALPADFARTYGADGIELLWPRLTLGSAQLANGRWRDAVETFTIAHGQLTTAFGPDYRSSGVSAEIAWAQLLGGDPEAAWRSAQRSETEVRASLGDGSGDDAVPLGTALVDVARIAVGTGHLDDAARRLAEIERLFAAREPDDDAPAVAAVVAAELALARGDATAARDHAAAAQAWLEQHEFGTSDAGIEAAVVRAHAERVLGDDAASRTAAEHAVQQTRSPQAGAPAMVVRAAAALALAAAATDVAAAEAALAVGEQALARTTIDPAIVAELELARLAVTQARDPATPLRARLDALALPAHATLARAERGWLRRGAAR